MKTMMGGVVGGEGGGGGSPITKRGRNVWSL